MTGQGLLGGAGWDGAGRVGFDPAARRRVRRAGARARPLLVPLALVLSSAVLVPAGSPETPPAAAPVATVVPDGMVLVAVQPADAAVLPLAAPGSRVDVYAATGPAGLDTLGGAGPPQADLVVRDALVVPPPAPPGSSLLAGAVEPGGPGGLVGAAGAPAAVAVTLLVRDDEAAALAARPGGPLLLAVRGG